ncbi:hypothetical protein QUF70_15765 [Desulfobacterales bacterium HSG17]|nr:hypothetical protein [Desulfobacterales bacterium HSG17]
MTQDQTKPTLLWVLQDNQVSPIIVDFLKLLKAGICKINIQFIVPEKDKEILEMIKPLDPLTFQASRRIIPPCVENFQKKRQLIPEIQFSQGLEVWKPLITDDLGGGLMAEGCLHLPHVTNVCGIILQIPTPLGSSSPEEIIFYEWVKLARENNIFIAGYELLSLYTRWTLVPSMLDGIITTNELSFDYLNDESQDINAKIWKLPRYEGKVFSPGSSVLWRNGLQSIYHYRIKYNIPKNKIIVFLPHNVAMSYEYRRLIEEISIFGTNIHLMFCIGEDQTRGTHTHEQVIKTISDKTLGKFNSFSFHSLGAPWEMIMADVVLAASQCYSTIVAESNGIPCLVMDKMVPPAVSGYLTIINSYHHVRDLLKSIINIHKKTDDITDIIYAIVTGKHQKISYEAGNTP